MRVACLFSGGTDSALAALFLEPFCEVTLVTGTFGFREETVTVSDRAAAAIGIDHRPMELDEVVADRAVDDILDDGYPRNGIQRVHEHALEVAAELGEFDAVADGTRRDDRVPTIGRSAARSLEDRHGVTYCQPLAGIGRGARDAIASTALEFRRAPTEAIPTGDYEAELRHRIADRHGTGRIEQLFPEHDQSLVTGRRPLTDP